MNLIKYFLFFSLLFLSTFFSNSVVIATGSTFKLLGTTGNSTTSATNGLYNTPRGLDLDSGGNIFVADSGNYRIQKLNSTGAYITKVGSNGTANLQFKTPYDVAVDSLGYVYVADWGNHRIQKISNDLTTHIWTIGGPTSGSADGQFKYPSGIAIDSNDNVYVADSQNYRIQKFDKDGNFLGKWGQYGLSNQEFSYYVHSITVDSNDNVWALVQTTRRIYTFNSSGQFISSRTLTAADGISALNSPEGIDIDSSGNIYIADGNNTRVIKLNSNFVYQGHLGGFAYSRGIVVDNTGKIFMTDNHRLRRLDYTGVVYQATSVAPSLDLINLVTNLKAESDGIYGLFAATATSMRLKYSNGLTLSDFSMTLSSDSDFTSVNGSSDQALGKAYVHNLIGTTGVAATHTLYVPIPSGKSSTSVFICPNADSLENVNLSCPGGVSRTAGSYTESFGNITVSLVSNLGDNVGYWKIAGMTGSGGLAEGISTYSGSGSGTVENPYVVSTCSELQELKDNRSSHYVLAGDIDCSATIGWNGGNGFIPIGTYDLPFTGSLSGSSDYEISNLHIAITANYAGLFGATMNASISDIHLTNLDLTKYNNTYDYIGGLIGYMTGGTITNSHVQGILEQLNNDAYHNTWYVGGLIGYLYGGTITDTYTDVDITLIKGYHSNIGGFVGYSRGTVLIEDSYTNGFVITAAASYDVGAFVGFAIENTTINRCYATGDVSVGINILVGEGDNYDVGGFAGGVGNGTTSDIPGTSTISNSYYTGNVLNNGEDIYTTGGFVGTVYDGGVVTNSYTTANVTVVNPSFNDINGPNETGGFVGLTRQRNSSTEPTITNCYATGSIDVGTGATEVGGFVGEHRNGVISNSYSTSNITVQHTGDETAYATDIGGFVGDMYARMIEDSFATGNITHVGEVYNVGGFVGYTDGDITIERSAAFGNVTGYDNVGGFAGYLRASFSVPSERPIVNDSFARGNATSINVDYEPMTGGFIGNPASVILNNTYSTGVPTALDPLYLGGYSGDFGAYSITSSYWDMQTSTLATDFIATGYTTAQMKDQANFIGWDFTNIWSINPAINDGYPYLGFMELGLENITLSEGTLDSSFDKFDYSYTSTLNGVDEINFTIDFDNPLIAGLTINGVPVQNSVLSPAFSLIAGENVFEVVLTTRVAPGVNSLSSYTYYITIQNGDVVVPPVEPPVEENNDNEPNNTYYPAPVSNEVDNKPEPAIPPVEEPPIVDEEPKDIINEQEVKSKFIFTPELQVGSAFITLLILEGIAAKIGLLKGNLWFAIVAIVDKVKKRRPWGIVYDSFDKKNLSRAILRVFDLNSDKLQDTVVTDGLGIFKLNLNPGRYKIEVSRMGYNFPSKVILTNVDGDKINVYRGGTYSVAEMNETVMMSIPIDKEEVEGFRKLLINISNIFEKFIQYFSPILLTFGLIYSMYIYSQNNNFWNLFVVLSYALVILVKILLTVISRKIYGIVKDVNGNKLENILIGLYDEEFDKLIMETRTNEKGEYNFVVQSKPYYLKIHNVNNKEKYKVDYNQNENVTLVNKDLTIS